MCEHCKTLDSVLAELLGRKPTDLIMKLVKTQVHGPLCENELDCAVQQ
jgi:hypothetical protein